MLNEKEIRATIVQRMIEVSGSCNNIHIAACMGQVRALIYVLGDGSPPISPFADAQEIFRAAGIPFSENEDGMVGWPDKWLKEHGFEIEDDGKHGHVQHPVLGRGW